MIDERPAGALLSGTRVWRVGARVGALLATGATVVSTVSGCTAGPGGTPPGPAQPTPPPAPPAACMLDTAALATTTGLTWTPDHTTASDTRCVYDPGTAAPTGAPPSGTKPAGPDFVAVDVTRFTGDPAAELDVLAEVCEAGSRAPAPDGAGFVCRFLGGSVYAAVARNGRAITIAASAVPAGTSAARLVVAFNQQLGSLR